MANWYGTARSSYFAVKDLAKFEAWAASRNLHVWKGTDGEHTADGTELVGICPDENFTDDGAWPSVIYDENDNDSEFEIGEELQEHLHPDWTAILMCVGAEKLRYVSGNAIIVTSASVKYLNLTDLAMKAAKQTGKHCTRPEY